jgi:hypothetical protein
VGKGAGESSDLSNNPDPEFRIARGEKCLSFRPNVRSACRDVKHAPGKPDWIVGFRIARTLLPKP